MDNNQCVERILIDREHRFWKNTKSVHVGPEYAGDLASSNHNNKKR